MLKSAKIACSQVKDLNNFNINSQNGLNSKNLKQLRELTWLESAMNLLVLGPPGVGKTFPSLGLGYYAVKRGYKAYLTLMDDLLHILKTSEFVRSSKARKKQILDSNLIIIDDINPQLKHPCIGNYNQKTSIYYSTRSHTNKNPQ